MDSLNQLEVLIKKNTSIEDRKIIGIWTTDCLYNPLKNGRIFRYKYLIVQTTTGQGCAYSTNIEYDIDYLENLIGTDCLSVNITDMALKVACLDSLSSTISYNYKCDNTEIDGTSYEKLSLRTALILSESKKLLGDLKGKKVLNIGVVGDIINEFLLAGCHVMGTDFDNSIVGKKLFDMVPIYNGTETLSLLEDMDLAVITGMTITTNTIDDIIRICNNNGCKTIVFAETGANMGQYYVEQGIDVFLGEPYPFYIFNGKTFLQITRKNNN